MTGPGGRQVLVTPVASELGTDPFAELTEQNHLTFRLHEWNLQSHNGRQRIDALIERDIAWVSASTSDYNIRGSRNGNNRGFFSGRYRRPVCVERMPGEAVHNLLLDVDNNVQD